LSQKLKSAVIPFRPSSLPAAPAAALPLPLNAAAPSPTPKPTAIDLAGKRKAWFLIGRGRIGKTTLARWLSEMIEQRGGSAIFAAADPQNRSLRAYVNDVAEPPSTDAEEAATWFRELLQFAATEKVNAVIDLGGGNTMLEKLLAEVPDLADTLSAAGLEPVAIHLVGPHPHDLVPLATTEAAGFRPAATAIVANEAHCRRSRFIDVLNQPEVTAARDRGAIQLWMPMLSPDAARQCDTQPWHYHDAVNQAALLTASSVRTWLRRMGEEFEPITTWLPE
jgi:hypothetical protein